MTILQVQEHSKEWHDIRLKHVGGSEVAALLGVQAEYQQSAYTLWCVKSGKIPAPPVDSGPGSRIWFGTKLEPTIAALAAELNGWTIEKGGYCIDDLCPGKAASLDFKILEPGPEEIKLGFTGPGAMQVKNIDFLQHARSWTSGEPPFHILLQLQHDISSAGFSWGCIVGMVGGNEIEVHRYAARERTIDAIRQKVTEFWQGVRENKPPLADGSNSTADALAELYPTLPGEQPIDLCADNELPQICAGLMVAAADRAAAEKNEQAYKNRLTEKMAGHRRAVTNGFAINGVFTPENPGRPAKEGEIIGKRKASIWYRVKEDIKQ